MLKARTGLAVVAAVGAVLAAGGLLTTTFAIAGGGLGLAALLVALAGVVPLARPQSVWARWRYDDLTLAAAAARLAGQRIHLPRGPARGPVLPVAGRWSLALLVAGTVVAAVAGTTTPLALCAALTGAAVPVAALAAAGRRQSRTTATALVGFAVLAQVVVLAVGLDTTSSWPVLGTLLAVVAEAAALALLRHPAVESITR